MSKKNHSIIIFEKSNFKSSQISAVDFWQYCAEGKNFITYFIEKILQWIYIGLLYGRI